MNNTAKNFAVFKGCKQIDSIFQSFNSIQQLKSFCREKYTGRVQVYSDDKILFSITCNSENFYKRKYQ